MGMVHDVNRAIHWMKENAHRYGVDPGRIVLGGGSAGAHLALLTAYTEDDPRFTPAELEGKDTHTCAVISLYGSNDLTALYYHTNQHLTTRSIPGQPKKKVPEKIPAWVIKKMGKEYHRLGMDKDFKSTGALPTMLGGHPDEVPGTYALFSPVTHVHTHCPPTLLIHDEDDIMAPVKPTRFLYLRLVESNVPTVMHILPQTDHGFDLTLPNFSPAAHNALYDVERFLALMQVENGLQKDNSLTGKKLSQQEGITRH
jgi:acetyl esterase/lipase